jgi:hypothetical protein
MAGPGALEVALFREHQAGRLDLDAPVHQHLPWLPLATPFGPITARPVRHDRLGGRHHRRGSGPGGHRAS